MKVSQGGRTKDSADTKECCSVFGQLQLCMMSVGSGVGSGDEVREVDRGQILKDFVDRSYKGIWVSS